MKYAMFASQVGHPRADAETDAREGKHMDYLISQAQGVEVQRFALSKDAGETKWTLRVYVLKFSEPTYAFLVDKGLIWPENTLDEPLPRT